MDWSLSANWSYCCAYRTGERTRVRDCGAGDSAGKQVRIVGLRWTGFAKGTATVDIALVMVKSDGSVREFKLDKASTLIGRDEHAKLRIPVGSVSRRHCELSVDDDELIAKDLGSSNGTFVNGKRVKMTELGPGDLLAVGPVVFVVRIDGHPKEINAKDAYAAGQVGVDEEDGGHGPKGAGGGPVTMPMDRVTAPKPPASLPPPGSGKPAGKKNDDDDDDDFDFGDLLKDLDLDDDDKPKKK